MKKSFAALVAAGMIFTLANTASAHILITPKQPVAGTVEQYRVVAPLEKDANFSKFRLEIPSRVKLLLVAPVAGWTYEIEKDENGTVKAVVWTATTASIKKGEFAEFSLVGMNSKEATSVAWNAYQTYADGSKDEWIGNQDSDHPAPFVTMVAPATAVDHHGNPLQPGQVDKGHDEAEEATATAASAEKQEAATPATDSKNDKNVKISLFLSAAALLASLASLVLLFRKRG